MALPCKATFGSSIIISFNSVSLFKLAAAIIALLNFSRLPRASPITMATANFENRPLALLVPILALSICSFFGHFMLLLPYTPSGNASPILDPHVNSANHIVTRSSTSRSSRPVLHGATSSSLLVYSFSNLPRYCDLHRSLNKADPKEATKRT